MKVAMTSERSPASSNSAANATRPAPSSARNIRGMHSATGMSRSSILRGVLSATRFSTAPIASTRSKIDHRVSLGVGIFGCALAGRREHVAAQQSALGEFFCCLAIALIFKQALDQVALELLGFLGIGELRMRQHRERFDQQQRRRHHQVFARHVEVQLIQQFEPRQILLGDDAGGDFVRIELCPLEQMQQQVERALVNRKPEAHPASAPSLGGALGSSLKVAPSRRSHRAPYS